MVDIVTRAGKGAPLTTAEMDANFTNMLGEFDSTLAQTASDAAAAAASAASAASAVSSAVAASLAASTASAAQAATARDQAVSAWSASTSPSEVISAKSQSLHIGTIVASCIDLPSRHSDGGAWIDRCQDKSWYTETLGGDRWIGQQATIAAAWTAAGSATGAVFQASATAVPEMIGKFYAVTSATTAIEVFRGIKREYPKAGVAWIAESARVVGYDLGSGAMWMVFLATTGLKVGIYGMSPITSLDAIDGELVVGGTGRVSRPNFVKDYSQHHHQVAAGCFIPSLPLSSRNSAVTGFTIFT